VNTARPVLVTGGTGFIGRHLVAALRAQDTPVRVVIRRADLADSIAALGAEPVVGDLRDPAVVPRAVAGVRAVYHLAGRLFSPGEPSREYERLHVDATAALLEASVAAGNIDFFLLCSTTGVHGATGSRLPREDDPGQPTNAYEATKARAEKIASDVAKRHGLNVVIARPGLVYGPGDRHLLGLFRAIRGGYYRVIGSGGNRFHPIYIDDLIRGLLLSASAAKRDCPAYHLVGSRPVSMRELSDSIGASLGRPVPKMHLPTPLALALGGAMEMLPVPRRMLPLTRSRVRFMTQDRAYDDSRARTELGFVPRIELQEGLDRTVAWYRNNSLL
jgi:nucleoside-diphosphate-sugar epimerase